MVLHKCPITKWEVIQYIYHDTMMAIQIFSIVIYIDSYTVILNRNNMHLKLSNYFVLNTALQMPYFKTAF